MNAIKLSIIVLFLSAIQLFAIDGFPGTNLEFDGFNDYVDLGEPENLKIENFTLSCWFKRTGTGVTAATGAGGFDAEPLITKGRAESDGSNVDMNYFLGIRPTDNLLVADLEDMATGLNHPVIGVTTINNDEWYHATVTYDGTSWKLYLNGNLEIEQVENATPRYDSVQDNAIGSALNSLGNPEGYFNGLIDEVSIWNAARTTEEIRESMHLPLVGTETGLISYWQFNDGSDEIAIDMIGSNNGMLTLMDDSHWVNSTIPFGSGSVNTQIVKTTGLVDFTGTDLSIDFTEKTGTNTIVVTKLDLAPNIIPVEADEVFDSQYWVIRKYGAGSYISDPKFTISEDLTIEDENYPERINLYARGGGSDTDWLFEAKANSVNSLQDKSEFTGVDNDGQFILGRYTNLGYTDLYPQDNQTNVLLKENLILTFDGDVIAGVGNIYVKRSSDDSIYETIPASTTLISDAIVTINPVLDFEYSTDYYVLIDSTAFMTTDSIYFSGIDDINEWNFRSRDMFMDISAELTGVGSSSVVWGDYDNDGDLDILLTGDNGSDGISIIYQNNDGIFTDINAVLELIYYGSVAWGDYDNDGDLDILLTGSADSGRISIIYQNNDGVFTDIGAGLEGVSSSSAAWGDYDNDGDLDILLTGYTGGYTSNIYRNDSGVFTDIGAGLESVSSGSVAWGDYDNDGDLDILLTGFYYDGSKYYYSIVYRNDSGIFTDIEAGLTGVSNSSVVWGDYDNDGDLDILLTGDDGSGRISIIYQNNNNGVFTDINAGLQGVDNSSVAWGDYDNDGDLDILLTGSADSGRISIIYQNNNEVFTDIDAGLEGIYEGSVAWGDYDNDGDLDILLTGDNGLEKKSIIYNNDMPVSNTVPLSPVNLTSAVNGADITLSWDKATDNETPQNGLSYNLYCGTVDNKDSVKSSMSDIGIGYRKIVSLGNTNQNTSWIIKDIPDGEYYWSVQAVDHAFAGSEFSTEQIFTIGGLGIPQNVTTEIGEGEIRITWDVVDGAASYKVYASTDPYGTFADVLDTGLYSGLTWSIPYTESKKFYYVVAVEGGKEEDVETPIHRVSK